MFGVVEMICVGFGFLVVVRVVNRFRVRVSNGRVEWWWVGMKVVFVVGDVGWMDLYDNVFYIVYFIMQN